MSLLVQGMAQLQQAYLGRPEGDLKGTVDLPSMPEVGPDAAVEFSDWIYEAEQAIGSLSDRAALWFSACLEVARATYDTYVTSTPLQRLSLTPEIPLELKDQKWSRLERKVMTLLLNAMKKTAKDEVITYRISSVPALLYRMYVRKGLRSSSTWRGRPQVKTSSCVWLPSDDGDGTGKGQRTLGFLFLMRRCC